MDYFKTFSLPEKLRESFKKEFKNRLITIEYKKNLIPKQLNQEQVKFLLFLSIYYKRVIAPFRAVTNFVDTLTKFECNEMIMGKQKINVDTTNKFKRLFDDFNKILTENLIPLELFDYSDTEQFLGYLNKFMKTKENDRYKQA